MSEQWWAAFRILCNIDKGNPVECIQHYSPIHFRRRLRYFTKATRKALLQLGSQKWQLWYIRGNQGCFPPLLFALSGFFTACVVSEGLWDISFCCCSSFGEILQPISCSLSLNHYSKPEKEGKEWGRHRQSERDCTYSTTVRCIWSGGFVNLNVQQVVSLAWRLEKWKTDILAP